MSKNKIASNILVDQHSRVIDYVRIAVTDRCNLRCFYCMPEQGINYIARKELLTYEELLRIHHVLAGLGINKVRITGGEPFLRKELTDFIKALNQHSSKPNIHITTNGTLTAKHIPHFKSMGIQSVNLSLDSLDGDTFYKITRRNELDEVNKSFHLLLDHKIPTKINMVVMGGLNDQDVVSMAELSRNYPVEVRFIEEMPFNGAGVREENRYFINHQQILDILKKTFSAIKPIAMKKGATAQKYVVPGFKGSLGIIAAYSRTFCGTCNRIRITPVGTLKTCLYDQGVFNIKSLLREGASDKQVAHAIQDAVSHKAVDGIEAEANRNENLIGESMATIGG